MSSLSRAFTTRRAKSGNEAGEAHRFPQRSNTTSGKASRNVRAQISAPIQLVHTTNMLSYNAPDLPRSTRSNSVRTNSDDDSASQRTEETTPPTSPDIPAVEPFSPSKEPVASYFLPQKRPFSAVQEAVVEEAPAIPKRSPSHTKKNSSEAIARHRSIRMSRESGHSRQLSRTFSTVSTASTAASSTSHHSVAAKPIAAPPQSNSAASRISHKESQTLHPFGQELAQVSELAEEFGTPSKLKTINEDYEYIQSHGLYQWSASEYLGEISGLHDSFFPETLKPQAAPLWI